MNTSIKIPEVRTGINYCLENATELITEAEILLDKNKYARAYSLSQLALEEVGKSMMLFDLYQTLQAGKRKDFDFKKFSANFRDHKHKTWETKMINIMMRTENKSEDFNEFAKKNFAEMNLAKDGHYDRLKNCGFYVSLENNKFQSPNQIFNVNESLVFINESKKKLEFVKDWITKWLVLDEQLGLDKEDILKYLK